MTRSLFPALSVFALSILALAPLAAQQPVAVKALPDSFVENFDWRSIGPANMGGRITDFTAVKGDASRYWVATATGGLLKTVNGGVTYEHQFQTQGSSSIGAVAVAPSNPDVLYVGTGEENPRNSVSWGDGVYKSVDGGTTWKNVGLKESFQTGAIVIHPENPDVAYVGALGRLWGPGGERGLYKTTDGGENWERIHYVDEDTGVIAIAMHPTDPDTLLIATYERRRDGFDTNDPAVKWGEGGGVWKTTDGGASFRKISAGLPSGQIGRIGLDFYAKNPERVYMVLESEKATQVPENAAFAGLAAEDVEVGARITQVSEKEPGEAAGLKVGDIVVRVNDKTIHDYDELLGEMRSRLAGDTVSIEVSRDKKPVVVELTFALHPDQREDKEKAEEETEDAPELQPWQVRAEDLGAARPPEGPFGIGLGGQRENAQRQQGPEGHEFGGIYRSDDAGDTWTRINSLNPRPMYYSQVRVDPSDDNYVYVLGTSLYKSSDGGETFTDDGHGNDVHVDHHALWIDPADGRHILLGNDGGIYVTRDRMEHWDHHNHVALGQFYQVAVGPRDDYRVYGGLQDNGSWGGPSRSASDRGPVNTDWINVGGGDGFVVRVDREDPDLVYSESQNGAMSWQNLRTGERGSARPRGGRGVSYRFNWNTPYILSAHNSRIHYSAGNFVFRSLNRGANAKAISPEITRTDRGSGTALSESPVDEAVLYVGTDDGALWGTQDFGENWTNLWSLEEETPEAPAAAEPGGGIAASRVSNEVVEAAAMQEPVQEPAQDPLQEPAKKKGGWEPAAAADERVAGMLERFKTMDANGDGLIQASEAPERMGRMFEGADADGDGAISADEVRGMASRFGGGQGRQGGGNRAFGAGEGGGAGGQFGGRGNRQGGGRPAAAQEPAIVDPIAGTWTAQAIAEQIPEGEGEFTVVFEAKEGGGWSGSMSSQMGDSKLAAVKFDPETGKLSYSAEMEGMGATMEFAGKVDGDSLTGNVDVGGGMFGFEVKATRTKKPAAQEGGRGGRGNRGEQDPDREGHEWTRINDLLPAPLWVSSLVASAHKASRVYATFDGHRSDLDTPFLAVSEDFGRTWRALIANLPATAGSARVITEDLVNPDLLFLGTEFGACASIDRGASWTRINNDLPTVPVHDFAIHPTRNELLAGTHGRSLWVLDITALRQMSAETVSAASHLYKPNRVIRWRREPSRGDSGTRRFVGENPDGNAHVYYSLGARARTASLKILDTAGTTVRTLEAATDAGLHAVEWDMRRDPQVGAAGGQGGRGGQFRGGGRRGGRFQGRVEPGTYVAVLDVDGTVQRQTFEVQVDPNNPDGAFLQFEDWEDEIFEDEGGTTPDEKPIF
ncbi:MAG TPA: PDZ domain-containing protein [Planctomycetota bacterium]